MQSSLTWVKNEEEQMVPVRNYISDLGISKDAKSV